MLQINAAGYESQQLNNSALDNHSKGKSMAGSAKDSHEPLVEANVNTADIIPQVENNVKFELSLDAAMAEDSSKTAERNRYRDVENAQVKKEISTEPTEEQIAAIIDAKVDRILQIMSKLIVREAIQDLFLIEERTSRSPPRRSAERSPG